ncbi:fungal-specific transcription factor domain-containing protein [Exophiala viscosa]|uniref:Fungal-specific transcription factor domain-containing protein n=1 Tax=Exophiala viscosa TaxID=2486360 RepID=A0AAN6E5S7_9EURO|nr:fungal-specific transcription factor domain-containing protein [Exophiala viscosa]KAI1627645.1 fungal-specific transcription factor domain-containing protein [Exophiala viscosa]
MTNQTRLDPDVWALLAETSLAGTRNRRQLSCTPCRQRKLKCNRGKPCENCSKRKAVESCAYPDAASRGSRKPVKVQERINRLESLFLELSSKNNVSFDAEDGAGAEEPSMIDCLDPGHQVLLNDSRMLRDGHTNGTPTNWQTTLEDITEIREYFEDHDQVLKHDFEKLRESRAQPKVWDLIYGISRDQDLSALITCLPERSQVDRLVANYFEMASFFRPVVHPKQFQREYYKFWQAPYSVSKAWLGLLFAVLRLSAQTTQQLPNTASSSPLDVDETISTFRLCALRCLTLDDYARANIHLLQGLLTHLEAEYFQSLDPQANFYILTGTTVRVSLMIGLNRDAAHDSKFTTFECEMRRRLWLCIVHGDILLSFQMGLPSMIPYAQSDTTRPRNLAEDDFDEDTEELPASRPVDGTTTMGFYLAKAPVIEVFGKIAAHVQSVISSEEDSVMKLDTELRAAHDSVPAYYRVRPIEESLIDPAHIIMRRFAIDQIYLTGLCILHRKGLVVSRTDERFSSTRKSCVEAAMTLLDYQAVRNRETKTGGRLAGLGGTMLSITKNDWLLAAMLICLDLHLSMTKPSTLSSDMAIWGRDRHEEMSRALETSYYIWKESSEESVEALKATEALAAMLARLRPDLGIMTKYGPSQSLPSSMGGLSFESGPGPSSVVLTSNTEATTSTIPNGTSEGSSNSATDVTLPVTQVFMDPNDINWDELDRYFISSMPSATDVPMDLSEVWLNDNLWPTT